MNKSLPITAAVRGIAPLLQVYDMYRSLEFYCDFLGFEIADKAGADFYPIWAMVELNGVQLMFEPIYTAIRRPAEPDPVRMRYHQDTVLYFGCPDVDALYAYFVSRRMELRPPVITQYGFKAIYLMDPDGYKLVWHCPLS
jgi:glyoxylase I family protein